MCAHHEVECSPDVCCRVVLAGSGRARLRAGEASYGGFVLYGEGHVLAAQETCVSAAGAAGMAGGARDV